MRRLGIARRVSSRLKAQAGETLVETLVSILVGSLSLLLLAVAIGASVNIILTSKRSMEAFYEAEASMASNTGVKSSESVSLHLDVPISRRGADETVFVYEPDNNTEDIRLYERSTP